MQWEYSFSFFSENLSSLFSMKTFSRFFLSIPMAFGLLGGVWPVQAFPPGLSYTLFGNVRDQYGVLLPTTGASIVTYVGLKEMQRQSLVDVPAFDYNYQLRLRIDMARPETATYHPRALSTGSVFNLVVVRGNRIYRPIEAAMPLTVGAPADRKRLDLTLGVDLDGDGLPDAWEEAQLHQAGEKPGANGWELSKVDRDGDYDGDGISNWNEYLAGTYALDATSMLDLEIVEKLGDSVRLEFYSFYGRQYRLETSTDLKAWVAVPFAVALPTDEVASPEQSSLTATTTGPTSIYVESAEATTHYRLLAR